MAFPLQLSPRDILPPRRGLPFLPGCPGSLPPSPGFREATTCLGFCAPQEVERPNLVRMDGGRWAADLLKLSPASLPTTSDHPLLGPSEKSGEEEDGQNSMEPSVNSLGRTKKQFKCRECGMCFSHCGRMRIHQQTHTKEKPFEYMECGKSYSCSQTLGIHQRNQMREKQFKCIECGKSFSESRNLRLHQRTNTGENPFECIECGKNFSQSGTLRKHQQTHTGQKPFKCMECGKSFRLCGDLNIHERIHTGEKPYKCIQCSTQASLFTSHQETHKGRNQF